LIGIDSIAFYTSHYYLDVDTLAEARCIDKAKFHNGLNIDKISFPSPGTDIVTLAANAAEKALKGKDRSAIDMLLFATESGIDQSKSAGIYVHALLGLQESCRVVELKQACYAATIGIQMALDMIRVNPQKKVLVIASDVAKYELEGPGEPTQGCGAVAMVLSSKPSLLVFDQHFGAYTQDVMDFWRPNYSEVPYVDGKYSMQIYLEGLERTWERYQQRSKRTFSDHINFCYHVPFPSLVEKAHRTLAAMNQQKITASELTKLLAPTIAYNRMNGNCYTASLYLSLISLLENANQDLAGQRIGLYSYGSGCAAEFFSAEVVPGYRHVIDDNFHKDLFRKRQALTFDEYLAFYHYQLPDDGSPHDVPYYATGRFRLSHYKDHKRYYTDEVRSC